MKKYIVLYFLFAFLAANAEKKADLCPPLKIPAVLAGNFGELRTNHFHSGLDFKTQGKTGYNIYCAADGYVSRVLVSPWGFGRAVYVTHPGCGLITVYGHLSAFSTKIDKIVRAEQYKQEAFSIDMTFGEGEIPVKRGEIIALSGNAGSSAGPHLHMDVRDLETNDALDGIEYYKSLFKDTAKPEVRGLALYPLEGGVVNGGNEPTFLAPAEIAKGFTAWGNVSPAINAYDRMTGTTNIYGVKYLTLTVDGKEVYSHTIDRYSFDNTRGINTLANYATVQSRGRWYMWTYVPPTSPLGSMVKAENQGIVCINEERDYKCVYTLRDAFGNTAKCSFTITGKRQEIKPREQKGVKFDYNGSHTYNVGGIRVDMPKGVLYEDMDFVVNKTSSTAYYSDIYTVGDVQVPLASSFEMKIDVKNDTLPDKSKYCLVRLGGKYPAAVYAKYDGGKMTAKVNRFGKYAVTKDVTSPSIAPLQKAKWGVRGEVTLKISDNLSGIETYRGEIDGKFVLFELDGKTGKITFKLNTTRVKKGINHRLKITVTDACGNTKTENYTFKW